MIYVYRKDLSKSARDLVEALGTEAMRWRDRQRAIGTKARQGDAVIAWGDFATGLAPGVKALNNVPLQNKYADAVKLKEAGVPTVEVSRTIPQDIVTVVPAGPDPALDAWRAVTELAEDFLNIEIDGTINRSPVLVNGVDNFAARLTELRQLLLVPAPTATETRATAGTWLGRDRNHVGGADLLTPTTTPDYYVKKEEGIVREFRVHSFLGKSIRAGVKDHRIDQDWVASGKTPHEWIRSWDGGWRIKYDGITTKQRHRDIAAQAVAALGLDFGAVDIGERADNSLIVFEVNRAPGIEMGILEAYTAAISRWLTGDTTN